MRFEKIDGEQHIILEDGEEVFLTTPNSSKTIKVDNKEDKLNISGHSSLVGKITGEGMLEKVYIPPVVASDEIIRKCDVWLEMYKQVHDTFKSLALTDKYRKQNVVMQLSFSTFFSTVDDNVRGSTINLDLVQHGTIVQEGMTISIDDDNEDVYKYLVANVLSHYISKNYMDAVIDNQSLSWNHILYSSANIPRGQVQPLVSNLSLLYEKQDLARIVTSLITSHNLGASSDQLIANLRNRVASQKISERLDNSIDHSAKQYKYVNSNFNNKSGQ